MATILQDIKNNGKLILEELKAYINKINKLSKDELVSSIPDMVEKINSYGILNSMNDLGMELANKIDFHKLRPKINSLKLVEIQDLVSRFLPFILEAVVLIAPKLHNDYNKEYVILRDKLFKFSQSEYIETFEKIVPVVLKEGIKITDLIRDKKYEELTNDAPTLVHMIKNDFSDSTIDFIIKIPSMLGELDPNFVNALLIPIISAIIYLDKCVKNYEEENPRIKKYLEKMKSKEISLKVFMSDLLAKGEEVVMLVLSETKSIISFAESIKILPQILTLLIKQVNKQLYIDVKDVNRITLRITGQLPGPIEMIEVSSDEIEKSGMAGIWLDLNVDSLSSIFYGVAGIASLLQPVTSSELVTIKNLDKLIEMIKDGVDGWTPSEKIEVTILSIFNGLSGLLESESIFKLVENIVYPGIDSALRKHGC